MSKRTTNMSAQEILQFTYEKLIAQGEASVAPWNNQMCMYRADGTAKCPTRCAVGHLIPDSMYRALMEQMPFETLLSQRPELIKILPNDLDEEDGCKFIRDLQLWGHDYPHEQRRSKKSLEGEGWCDLVTKGYNQVAAKYNLNPVEVNNATS